MNSDPVDFCPYRANLDWSNVQTQDFSKVKYFEASDSELENGELPLFSLLLSSISHTKSYPPNVYMKPLSVTVI